MSGNSGNSFLYSPKIPEIGVTGVRFRQAAQRAIFRPYFVLFPSGLTAYRLNGKTRLNRKSGKNKNNKGGVIPSPLYYLRRYSLRPPSIRTLWPLVLFMWCGSFCLVGFHTKGSVSGSSSSLPYPCLRQSAPVRSVGL